MDTYSNKMVCMQSGHLVPYVHGTKLNFKTPSGLKL